MTKLFRQSRRNSPEEITLSADPPVSEAEALQFLSEADITACEPIDWGSNYSFAVVLRHDDIQRLAIYKPRRGEVPLWDFPNGTLYKREVASYLTSQALGWDFIPTTVIRDGPYGVGSVQLYVDSDSKADPRSFRHRNLATLVRMALFDIFANNADRKMTHFLHDPGGRLWGIDHGLTFNVEPKLRTVIWEFCGEPIPEDVLAEMHAFLANPDRTRALTDQLTELLSKEEIKRFISRFERLLKLGKFPNLDPYRNVPRGFW